MKKTNPVLYTILILGMSVAAPSQAQVTTATQKSSNPTAESTTTSILQTTATESVTAELDFSTTSVATPRTSASLTDNSTSVTLPGGVIYQVLKPGAGAKPGTTSTLHIHYTLFRVDGTKIESSRDAEFPIPFSFTPNSGEAIKGMELGTAAMQVGEIRKLFVPSELAYGKTGQEGKIPPDSDLVFEVELVDFKDVEADAQLQLNP